ncbi:uncharacterized protein G6M90_00g060370 [Metarhizium brunneum]|uniref:Uncharacterized protein n=1 Tax=Metarhizium brunneum TaxID=500148 RepID=A0A7D5UZ17_9HYPO
MSRPNRPAVVAANNPPPAARIARNLCAMVVGEPSRRQFIGGQKLGLDTDIECFVMFIPRTDAENWFGFSIQVPLSADTEALGLGKWHTFNETRAPVTTDSLYITVKFPRESTLSEITPVDGVLLRAFPPALQPGKVCQLYVSVRDPDAIQIEGIGMPFANPGHKCESWMRNGAVFEGKTLLDILKSGTYTFVVNRPDQPFRVDWNVTRLPPRFQYPWGTVHYWDEQRYHDLVDANKGPQFAPARSFDSDNSHLAVLTQSLAQDIMWVDRAAKEIYSQFRMRVYFIGIGNVVPSHQYYVLVPLEPGFRSRFAAAWRRLAQGILELHIFDEVNLEGGPIANWLARIVDNPRSIDDLANHVVRNHELILHNCAALHFDSGIDDYVRKIDAVCQFAPDSRPSNPALFGVEIGKDGRSLEGNQWDVTRVKQRLEVARAAVRGRGFYGVDIAVAPIAAGNPDHEGLQAAALGEKMPILPRVNMLNIASGPERGALMRQLLPHERGFFSEYLESRPLGLGLATAEPGFRRTSLLAVAAYGMIRTFKSIYVSAPTDVAVDNIAARMYETSRRVVETANGSMESGNPNRLRRLLVIRGHKPDDEMAAFLRLLRNPNLGDQAAPESACRGASRWKLHLSLAYWALKILRSQAVEPLHQDDSTALYQFQARIDNVAELAVLRGVAAGDQPWRDYEAQPLTDNQVKCFLGELLLVADAVATTPTLSWQLPYKRWKDSNGHAVVIDQADNISRPDLYSVWGNTMIPLFLAGNEKQPQPTVRPAYDKDDKGNALNRHAADAGISALEFFKGIGWPVFRLNAGRVATFGI